MALTRERVAAVLGPVDDVLEHDPEKWTPVFRKRSCSTNRLKRDDDSKKSYPALVAQIIAAGASEDELIEAYAWLAAEDALMNEGRAFPSGRVGRLVRLMAELEAEERSAWENV